MIVIIVNIQVRPEFLEDFVKESQLLQAKSLEERGCKGYQILRNNMELNKFTFVESFESEAAITEHKATPHFQQWRNNVYEMMETERVGTKHHILE